MLQSKGGVPGVGSNQHASNPASSGNDDKQLPQLEDDEDGGFEDGMEDDEAELISDPRNSGAKQQQMMRGRSNSDHRAPNNQQFELDEEGVTPQLEDEEEFDEEELRQEFQMSNNRQMHHHQHPHLNLDDEDDEELEKQLMQQL